MYLYEERYYLISNHAVARNSIFCDVRIQKHFKDKMDFYLEPICDILAYNLKDHEFQILVKLKKQEEFDIYFQSKYKDISSYFETPESTYIFSQAMSNLQVSLVKKFNHMFSRSGTLMASRFKRQLIISKEEVINLVSSLNSSKTVKRYSGIWSDCAVPKIAAMTSKKFYERLEIKYGEVKDAYWNDFKTNLVDTFNNQDINVQFYPIHYFERRLFRSICKNLE